MKRLLFLILILFLVLFGLSFATLNPAPVTVHYYLGSITAPLSLVLAMVLLLGVVLGIGSGLGLWLAERGRSARLQRRMKLTEQELKNLRTIPLKDER